MRAAGPDGFGDRVFQWKDREKNLEQWREKWADRASRELRKAGFELEADRSAVGHLKLEKQRDAAIARGDSEWAASLDREATQHRGPAVDAMERSGMETERGNAYRDTVDRNETLAQLKADFAALEKQIAAAAREQAENLKRDFAQEGRAG